MDQRTENHILDASGEVRKSAAVDNLQDATPELRRAVVNEFSAALERHGIDPATKAQAAAHEAAHVVVAHATGYTVTGVGLQRHSAIGRAFWGGATWRIFPGEEQRKAVRVQDEPGFAFRSAVNDLAGITGEIVAGLSHRSSSIDERLRAAAVCNALDNTWRWPAHATSALATAVCLRILTDNRQQFDAIRAHLQRTGWLSGVDVKPMLTTVCRFDLAELLPRNAR
jgi:hypothetical protein